MHQSLCICTRWLVRVAEGVSLPDWGGVRCLWSEVRQQSVSVRLALHCCCSCYSWEAAVTEMLADTVFVYSLHEGSLGTGKRGGSRGKGGGGGSRGKGGEEETIGIRGPTRGGEGGGRLTWRSLNEDKWHNC